MPMRALAAFLLLASPLASATPDIVERIDLEEAPVIRLRLTAPVHYVRHYPAEQGEAAIVILETRAPEAFGDLPIPDEVKFSPGKGAVPPFSVRSSLGAACTAARGALCLTVRFERPVRYRIGQGEDARSVRVEVLP
jgi:hypothetical protein